MSRKIIFVISLLFSHSLWALPLGDFDAISSDFSNPAPQQQNFDFNGIVKLSNCSGSVVRFNGQPDETPALVLTNGHCLGGSFLKPGEVIFNRNVERLMKVYGRDQKAMNVVAKKIIYATMTNTDMAIYQLQETYLDLQRAGVDALVLSGQRPHLLMPIEIISGYWDLGYRCQIADFIFVLREAEWTFMDSILYSQNGCRTKGGTSGSPIIDPALREVVGVNNTGNTGGRACSLHSPCEVNENGQVFSRKQASYGQQTYWTYSCLTVDFQIDLTLSGCRLPK